MADPYRAAGHDSEPWSLVGGIQAVPAPWLTRYHSGTAGLQRKREVACARIKKVSVDTFDEPPTLKLQIDNQSVVIAKGKEGELDNLAKAIRKALKMRG